MEDELTLLLDNRNKLLAELDEISDLLLISVGEKK